MQKKLFTFLFVIVASIGTINAQYETCDFGSNQVKGDAAATLDARVHKALDDLFVEELLPLSKKK